MPTVNKLGGTFTKTAGAVPADQGNHSAPINSEVTLIESKNEPGISSKVAIPSFLKTDLCETSDRQNGGYIGIAHERNKNFAQMNKSGISSGDLYLFHESQYLKVPELNYFLVTASAFATVSNPAGDFLYASTDPNQKEATYKVGNNQFTVTDRTNPTKIGPHYVGLFIVNYNGNLIPIKGDFRHTQSGGMESTIEAVRAAGDPASGWIKMSDQHKATAAFPQPFGRVFHTLRTKREIGKGSGMEYFRTVTVSNPASVSQMQELIDALSDATFLKALEEANRNYQGRVDFLMEVVKKSA